MLLYIQLSSFSPYHKSHKLSDLTSDLPESDLTSDQPIPIGFQIISQNLPIGKIGCDGISDQQQLDSSTAVCG